MHHVDEILSRSLVQIKERSNQFLNSDSLMTLGLLIHHNISIVVYEVSWVVLLENLPKPANVFLAVFWIQ